MKASIDSIVTKLSRPESLSVKQKKLEECKLSDLWNNIWKDVVGDPPPQIDFGLLEQSEQPVNGNKETGAAAAANGKPSESEIEEMIQTIMEMLPHLGDGSTSRVVVDKYAVFWLQVLFCNVWNNIIITWLTL